MIPSPRRHRLAAAASLVLLACAVNAQTSDPAAPNSPAPIIERNAPSRPAVRPRTTAPKPASEPAPQPSALTADLFYEILMGEMTARSGDPGSGYALVLDAARRLRDGKLFQRAVEIALQSRSGDAALAAARAWQEALPTSRDARRIELQILIALNRIGETVEPLRAEVAATSQIERPLLMAVIARNYSRASDKKLAASVVERALVDELKSPTTGGLAWATVGRLRLNAGDNSGALEAARKGQEVDPASDAPPALALELIDPSQPLAEPIVTRYLASNTKATPDLRIAYARVLVENRRYNDAQTQLQALTTARPELAEPWLLLGSLQMQARQDSAAETSLKRYIDLSSSQSNKDTDAADRKRGVTQAYLALSQLAERRKDLAGAERWLARIDSTEDLTLAQTRRAGLLARQGKLPQAREIIRALPERTPDDKKQKFLAEVQLLRDAKQYQAAYDMLAQASAAAPDDGDLVYDQAMVAEKLNRLDDMERLLRRLIQLKPESQNAYNALGYSFADRKIRLDEARTLIQKAVQLAPEDPFIADSLGWVEFRLGNTAEAIRILEAAYKTRPDPEIGAHFGEVLWSVGQKDRAVTIWKEALLSDAENETLQETLKRLRVKP
ncbi:tetratricopeptide (TPR) repeat protein [Variovorax boronicumulans]|uniref:tetratricopeptide repeat protein n=1 Tax=Variovorax boronicumulans TaxID=436515 RepID=UPI0027880F4E|nr:tetratricopeptide repeat protein [Variovorax boronicumulans]MDQ0014105.1 tetratricopeptide (TPR) repeat protein [Variovorax boronicumulans]